MEDNKITLTIHTCEKFSDIWEITVGLLNKNWADRNMRTLLITDEKTERRFDNIEIISTGSGLDMPARTKKAIVNIDTEYIFLTLDDYLITKRIDTKRINHLIRIMDENHIDYLSFKNHHKTKGIVDKEEKIFQLDLNSGEDYILNLYPGIWRTSFMKKTLEIEKNIWEYEVSLTTLAQKEKAVCCTSKGNQFEIMDGIRKGKILHKPYRYLKKHNLYKGNRPVIPYRSEIKLFIMDKAKIILPREATAIIKMGLRKMGVKFFS